MRNVESTELPLHRAVHVKSIAQPIVGRASEEGGGGEVLGNTHMAMRNCFYSQS